MGTRLHDFNSVTTWATAMLQPRWEQRELISIEDIRNALRTAVGQSGLSESARQLVGRHGVPILEEVFDVAPPESLLLLPANALIREASDVTDSPPQPRLSKKRGPLSGFAKRIVPFARVENGAYQPFNPDECLAARGRSHILASEA